MAGPRDYHTKQSKLEKERQTLHDITYVESKIYKLTYLQKRNRLTENRFVGAKAGEREFGTSRCK